MSISKDTARMAFEESGKMDHDAGALALILAYAASEAAALDLADCHYFITMAETRLTDAFSGHAKPKAVREKAIRENRNFAACLSRHS
jgi:hypothetical protein